VLGLFVAGAYLLAVAAFGPHLLGLSNRGTESLFGEFAFVGATSAALLAPAFLLYLASREFYARCSLPQATSRDRTRTGATGWIVLIILLILALVVLMYLLLGHTAVEPTMLRGEGG